MTNTAAIDTVLCKLLKQASVTLAFASVTTDRETACKALEEILILIDDGKLRQAVETSLVAFLPGGILPYDENNEK